MVKLNCVKNKTRRLRKKLYLGEFQVLGFRMKAKFKERLSFEGVSKACKDFVDYAEQHGLWFFSCFTPEGFGGGVQRERYASVTEQQRLDFLQWVKAREEVDLDTLFISELFDLHYATDEEMGL